MTDAVTAFFDDLGRQGHVPLLERLTGTLRLEVEDGDASDRWLIRVDRGDVAVSRRSGKADCTLRTERDVLRAIATGRVNALAAVLRGLVGIEGDLNMLVLFQRVFPGPPRTRTRKKRAAKTGGPA